jgi:hypothetical protein
MMKRNILISRSVQKVKSPIRFQGRRAVVISEGVMDLRRLKELGISEIEVVKVSGSDSKEISKVILDALKSDYLSHYGFIEEIRSKHDKTEINLIMRILDEGNSKGIFDIKDTYTAAFGIAIALKGLEIPMFLKNQIEHTEEKINFLLQILFKGIEKR